MGEHTKIEWAHHTFNPWRGCTRVSPGCDHCYAEAWSKRNPKQLGTWGDDGERVIASDAYWRTPLRWDRLAAEAGERRRVFCASLADVFEDRPELVEPRRELLWTIEATPNLDWLLLTKRPENAHLMLAAGAQECIPDEWPLPNVWLGVTAEDQERADERIPILLDTPAAVRFVSYEPALGPVDFSRWLGIEWMDTLRMPGEPISFRGEGGWGAEMFHALRAAEGIHDPRVDWIVVGGESGPHARPFDLPWARDVIAQGRVADVSVFVKQLGARPWDRHVAEGFTHSWPVDLASRKGGDIDEWPLDLRVRQVPERVCV